MEVFLRRRGRMKKIALVLAVLLSVWACATFSEDYELGTKAAMSKDWDDAVKYYERALWESPGNSVYRLALFRAKMAASYSHLQKARGLVAQGMKEEALVEYEKALSYDPLNRVISEEQRLLKGEEVVEEKAVEKRIEPPIKLKVDKEKVQLEFTKVNLRSIFQALAKFSEVNIIFDEQFKDIAFSISLKDVDFEEAIGSAAKKSPIRAECYPNLLSLEHQCPRSTAAPGPNAPHSTRQGSHHIRRQKLKFCDCQGYSY
jgi:tetratricopeptide (TPR) repeat protein